MTLLRMAVIIHEVSFTTTKRYKWEARSNVYWRERERDPVSYKEGWKMIDSCMVRYFLCK